MTPQEMTAMLLELKESRRQARPSPSPRPAVTAAPQQPSDDTLNQCIYGNCTSSSGASYRQDPAGGYTRFEDGAHCTQSPTGMGRIDCR